MKKDCCVKCSSPFLEIYSLFLFLMRKAVTKAIATTVSGIAEPVSPVEGEADEAELDLEAVVVVVFADVDVEVLVVVTVELPVGEASECPV